MCKITELYNEHSPKISSFVQTFIHNTADADQVESDTWLKICKAFHTYDQDRPFLSWAYTVTRSCVCDFFRLKHRIVMPSVQREDEYNPIDTTIDHRRPSQTLEEKETSEIVRKAIDKLPKKFRDCILKVYFEHKTFRQVSEELQIPLGTVKSRLFYSKEVLKRSLHDVV